jgi:hypothetical protein
MTLKLKTLLEGFAWQREAGKPLPTLADTTAAYQRKLDEQDYYRTHKRGKFGPGSRYNDEPDFNYSGQRDVVQNDKWDKLVDEYNNKPGYVVVSGAPRGLYMAKITNTETGDEWEIKFKYQQWTYQCKIGGRIKRFDSTADLINNFNEINGMQAEGAEPRWQDNDGDGKWYEPGQDVKEVNEGRNDHGLLDLVSEAENMVQRLRSNMATNSVLQRTEKMGYLGAYDELLDILSEIGYQAEMMEQ